MTSRELINAELDKLSDRDLTDFYFLLKQFIAEKKQPSEEKQSVADINRFSGILKCDGEDPLEYQRRIRDEWD